MDSDVVCYGKAMRAVTYYLGNHPLREWLENAIKTQGDIDGSTATPTTTTRTEPTKDEHANRRLRELLEVRHRKDNISPKKLEEALKLLTPEQVQSILNEMHELFPDTEASGRLEKVYAKTINNLQREL